MSEKGSNTNLAAEFYVLSMLYRLGINAHLTLGKEDRTVVEYNRLKKLKDKYKNNWNYFL